MESTLIALGLIVVVFMFGSLIAGRYQKTGPNQALIVSGRRRAMRDAEGGVHQVGFRIVKGGGTIVLPVIEKVDRLSMETMTIEVDTPEVYTQQGVPIIANGVAQIKVRGDEISIATAAEQFLSKSREDIESVVRQTLEGHLRAIMGMMTVEEVYRNRESFAQRVQDVAAGDLASMGFMIVSFTIKDVHDKQGYLEALGKPRIAQVKRDAEIAEAEARRDSQIRRAQAEQLGRIGEIEAQTLIAAAKRDYDVNVAHYTGTANQQKAEADLAYDLQKYKTEQLVRAEQVKVEIVEKEQQTALQEQEIQRRQRELAASVEKPAAAERARIEMMAEAEQFRLRAEAAGRAEAARLLGEGQAQAERAQGLAGADVIRARGQAEADAMTQKALAWHNYNEAAIAQILVERLPEIAQAISAPLAKTERIVMISQDGSSAASRVTRDVTDAMAQLPDVIEALTGIKLSEIVGRLPKVDGNGGAKAAPATTAEEAQPVAGTEVLEEPTEAKSQS